MAAVAVEAPAGSEEAGFDDTIGVRGGVGGAGSDGIVGEEDDIVRVGEGAWRPPLPPPHARLVASVAGDATFGDNVMVDRLIPFPLTRRHSEPEVNSRGERG